jgi:hypothetical protein
MKIKRKEKTRSFFQIKIRYMTDSDCFEWKKDDYSWWFVRADQNIWILHVP